jgi:hypothetical protein
MTENLCDLGLSKHFLSIKQKSITRKENKQKRQTLQKLKTHAYQKILLPGASGSHL